MRRLLLTRAVVVVCAIGALTIGVAGCGGKSDSAPPAGNNASNSTPANGTPATTNTSGGPAATSGITGPDTTGATAPAGTTDPRLASCRLWLQGANTTVAQSLPYERQAQQNAATAAATNPAWTNISQSMQVLVGLPPTGLSPAQVTQAHSAVDVITSNCAALGVHIPK